MSGNMVNSKIIIDVDKRYLKFCWKTPSNVLQRVGLTNEKVPFSDWKDFFDTLEKEFGDDTPTMYFKLNYKNDVMRDYVTRCDDGTYKVTLKHLPKEIFGQTHKTFKAPTIFECKMEAYNYVVSMKSKYNEDPQNRITFLENELSQAHETISLLKEEKKDLLHILDEMSDTESEKAASERKNESEKDIIEMEFSKLQYHYDWITETFRQVHHFDEFNQPVYARRGFQFNAEVGMRIIYLYNRKKLTPKQIINHMSLYNLNKSPHKTVAHFIKVWKEGLLEYAIRFCCNNSFCNIKYALNDLLRYPDLKVDEKKVAMK